MRRFTLLAVSTAFVAACASGSQGSSMDLTLVQQDFTTGPDDLSTDDSGSVDLATGDMATTPDLAATADMAVPVDAAGGDLTMQPKPDFGKPKDAALTTDGMTGVDGGITVPGTQLVAGNVALVGVTADGYAVYANLDKDEVDAVALTAGAMPSTIAAPASTADVSIDGNTVFVWTGVSQTTGVGALTVWTHATGSKAVSKPSIAGLAAATADASNTIYATNANTAGTTVSLVMSAPTLASPVTLLSSLAYPQGSSQTCFPIVGFVGTTPIATHCASGSAAATVSTYDGTGKATDLLTNAADFWDTDKAGDKVLLADATGTLEVTVPTGGTPTTIDMNTTSAFMTSDGAAVVYTNASGALLRAATTSPMPKTLVSSGAAGLILVAAASDSSYVIFYTNTSSTTGLSDLKLASGTTPGVATTLVSSTTGAIFGSAFTADNLHALFFSGVNANTATGTLKTAPVTGASVSTIGTNAWIDLATTGSKLVYNDNYAATGGVRGRADLKSVDATTPSMPKTIVPQADVDFDLDPTKADVVFTMSETGIAGLYVAAVP